METWRILPFDLGPSDHHFRQSNALVTGARHPTVWWHATDTPTIILGAAQAALEVSLMGRAGVSVVRRRTGGTAVYAGPGVLGQDVFLPAGHRLNPADVVETYRWLGEAWLDALRECGVLAHLVTIREAREQPSVEPEVALACFGSLSPYEITVGNRKLVGLAQVRRAHGTLLQSAIHLRFDAAALAALLPAADQYELTLRLRRAAVGLNEVTDCSVSEDALMETVNRAIERRAGATLRPGEWEPGEIEDAARLATT